MLIKVEKSNRKIMNKAVGQNQRHYSNGVEKPMDYGWR